MYYALPLDECRKLRELDRMRVSLGGETEGKTAFRGRLLGRVVQGLAQSRMGLRALQPIMHVHNCVVFLTSLVAKGPVLVRFVLVIR